MREPAGRKAFIYSLYDAALDSKQWTSIAAKLAHTLNAGSAAIQVRTPEHVEILSRTANFTDGKELAYRTYYHSRDILVDRAAAKGLNQILANADLITDKEWLNTEIYRDYFSGVGVHQLLGGVLPLPRNALGVFAVHRDRQGKLFSAEDKKYLAQVMHHVQNAIKIHQRLNISSLEQHATKNFLEHSTTALLVVDRAGRLLLASTKGEQLLERSLALTIIAGRVVAAQMSVHHQLMRLIEAAVDTASGRGDTPGGVLAIPLEHQPPLCVTVAPLNPQRDGVGLRDPAALILVRDPAERSDITPALRDLFGLTRSEALLANGLVNGLTIHEVALAHGVSLNTIRTQLKSVLAKTSTSRQTELVALILRCLAGQI